MAAESTENETSILEQLMRATIGGGREGGRPSFFPIIVGVMASSQASEGDPPQQPDRIVLVNPVTQGMVVLRGDAALLLEILSERGGGGGGGAPPASKASIEAMKSVEVEEEEECAVCLDELKAAAAVVKEMPCRHRFHGGCIEKWLGMHGSCPVCRYRMPAEDGGSKKSGGVGGGGGEEAAAPATAAVEGRRERGEVWVTIAFRRRDREDDERREGERGEQDE